MPPFISRREHFDVVGSTNDVVRGWLADGTPEVCLAHADAQTAGRGRDGRTWTAPSGAALLLSLGFRPAWLQPEHLWRLAAVTSLAMAEASELVTGVRAGSIRLKWPNDVVLESGDGVRKLAGVLGESDGLGSDDPRAVIGVGLNGDWPRDAFPAELARSMTSLREAAARAVDHEAVLEAFLGRLEVGVDALRAGRFDADGWSARQVTTGRDIDLIGSDGASSPVRAAGVDTETGALVIEGPADAGRRSVVVGEIRHVRLAPPAPAVQRVGV